MAEMPELNRAIFTCPICGRVVDAVYCVKGVSICAYCFDTWERLEILIKMNGGEE
jgi:uncharacterized protein (UPF0212 family)